MELLLGCACVAAGKGGCYAFAITLRVEAQASLSLVVEDCLTSLTPHGAEQKQHRRVVSHFLCFSEAMWFLNFCIAMNAAGKPGLRHDASPGFVRAFRLHVLKRVVLVLNCMYKHVIKGDYIKHHSR